MDYPYKGTLGKTNLQWKNLKEDKEFDPLHPDSMPSTIRGINAMKRRLYAAGGHTQQERMIKDKRKSLDRAVLYSYQAAHIRHFVSDGVETMEDTHHAARALINPNKLKSDYDEKVVSVGFEFGYKTGDIFEWLNTNSYWLIYLQDMTELAYFRGAIRRCTYEVAWEDENGYQKTYVALRGPVETKINYIQKHQISVDKPNYSLNILMPKTDATLKKFQRYSKFYLQNDDICWRVEAVDAFSTPGILEVNATEYYANEAEDDIENGIVGGLILEPIDPNPEVETIIGETFIKPKKQYTFIFSQNARQAAKWYIKDDVPVEIIEQGYDKSSQAYVVIKWQANYSGQFDLYYGNGSDTDSKKTIVVESLF